MNQDQPARPANILNIVAINQGKKPLTMEVPQTTGLLPEQVSDLLDRPDEAHIVVDTRSAAAFGSGHIPNAYNIQLSSPEFEQRVGWVTPLNLPIVLVLDEPANQALINQALYKLAFLGLDGRVVAYLSGGMEAWLRKGLPTQTLPQLSVQQLNAHLAKNGNGLNMQVLDVRETSEWDAGHIEQAHYMNYKVLPARLDDVTLTPNQHISVLCAAGLRSSTACSILMMNGFSHIYNITGGMTAWAAAGLPMVDAQGCVL